MNSTSLPRGARFAFLILASAASSVALVAFGAPADSTEVTAPQMIDAFEGDFGVHPGQRRNHTKGTCAAGEFVGTSDAAALSRSALFSGKTVPVVARFSLGGGTYSGSELSNLTSVSMGPTSGLILLKAG